MGRYIRELKLRQPIDVVSMIMEDYLYHHRFRRTDWNGEMVFGVQDAHNKNRYLKWSYAGGVFHVEAWLKGPFGGELSLDGLGGGASKNEFKESLEQMLAVLKKQPAQSISGGHVGSDPLHHTSNYATEHRMQLQGRQMTFGNMQGSGQTSQRNSRTTQQNTGTVNGNGGLVLAIVALLFSGVPVFGIVLGVAALKKCRAGSGSSFRAGKVLAILAIVMSAVTLITSFIPMILFPMFNLY